MAQQPLRQPRTSPADDPAWREALTQRITPSAKLVWLVLYYELARGQPGTVSVATTTLGGLVGCDQRSARRAVEELAEHGLVDVGDTTGGLWRIYVRPPHEATVARVIAGDQQRGLLPDAADNLAQDCPRPSQESIQSAFISQKSNSQSAPRLTVDFDGRGQTCAGAAQGLRPIGQAIDAAALAGQMGQRLRSRADEVAADLLRRVAADLADYVVDHVADAVADGRVSLRHLDAIIRKMDERRPHNRAGYFVRSCVELFAQRRVPWVCRATKE